MATLAARLGSSVKRLWSLSSMELPPTCPCGLGAAVEQRHENRDDVSEGSKNAQESPPAVRRTARSAAIERHYLPRPSRFAIGLPIPEAIKTVERAVLAKQNKINGTTKRTEHRWTRVASAG